MRAIWVHHLAAVKHPVKSHPYTHNINTPLYGKTVSQRMKYGWEEEGVKMIISTINHPLEEGGYINHPRELVRKGDNKLLRQKHIVCNHHTVAAV